MNFGHQDYGSGDCKIGSALEGIDKTLHYDSTKKAQLNKGGKGIRTAAQTAVFMAVLTLISKVFGFVREMVFAAFFGAGYVMDAYSMAQSIPNILFSGILQATAVSFMPLFSEKTELGGEAEGNKFLSDVLNMLLKASILLGILGIVFSKELTGIFAVGFNEKQAELTAFFLKVTFIYLIFGAINNILTRYLEYKGVFLRTIIFGYVQNIIVIIFAILAAYTTEKLLIVGMFLSYLACSGFNIYLTRKEGFKWKISVHNSGAARQIVVLALPAFIGGYVANINTYVDKMLSSGLPEGSVASLGYAMNVIYLVTGLSVAIISTIILPRLNQARARGELNYYNELLSGGFNLYAIIAIPFGFGAMTFAEEVVQVIYERGAFDPIATEMTAIALFWYGPFLCLSQLNNQSIFAFQTNKDMKTPMYVGFVSVFVNIILNVILVRMMGIGGIALATSVAAGVSLVVSLILLYKKYPELQIIESFGKLFGITFAALISVAISKGLYLAMVKLIWMPRLCYLGIAIIIAALIYLVLLFKMKIKELDFVKSILRKE